MSAGHLERVEHALAGDVRLWRVDLDAYARDVTLDGLSADERARAARMALAHDARRYLASRHALRRVLAAALDRSADDLVIESANLGKPYLREPGAPHFNLSHSAHVALIGLSPGRPIGVDIEVIREVPDAEALASAHFTPDERTEWAAAPGSLRDRTFLACWTRKEACVKALGVGLSAEPHLVAAGCGPEPRLVTVPLATGPRTVVLRSVGVPGEAVAAVALAEP
jgi:4'-phosphopantetheinyl transferase